MKAKSTRNTVQPVRFFQLAFLWVLILLLAGSSGAAWAKPTSGETAPGDILPEILSDGQFVDGPNVGAFELETFLNAQPGILKAPEYRNVIQDQADYFGIDDATALADHLARTFAKPEPLTARDLLPGLDQRVAAFAADFAAAVGAAESGFRR